MGSKATAVCCDDGRRDHSRFGDRNGFGESYHEYSGTGRPHVLPWDQPEILAVFRSDHSGILPCDQHDRTA